MADDRDERTEKPTEKRLRDAAERGQVPRSRDLSGALVVTAGLAMLGGGALGTLSQWLHASLASAGQVGSTGELATRMASVAATPFRLLLISLLVMAAAGVFGQLIVGGWHASSQPLAPDFDRFNPATNLRNLLGRGPAELVKSLLKALVVGGAVYVFFQHGQATLHTLASVAPRLAARSVLGFGLQAAIAGASGLLLVALADVPYQLWRHRRDLRMTPKEVRDELRETEGKPEVRSRLRRMQRQLARGRMIQAVRSADVVLVNPTHVAVALKYVQSRMRAPKVVAKGVGDIAERIRGEATAHHVPILAAAPLARALYRTTALGDDVPVTLYRAIAQVLAWVYQVRRGGADTRAPDIDLPSMPEARPWE
ncbi:MAG: EscU/YscU/HrcU family type III secretion system export apparatus switch protein [Rhodanobacteraceae bacterium]